MENPRNQISEYSQTQWTFFIAGGSISIAKSALTHRVPQSQLTVSYNHNVMDRRSRESKINRRLKGEFFLDFEMLDANTASALKKIISNPHFRRRVSVEEQRGQKRCRFLPGRATGAYDAAQGPSDVFNICLYNDDVQDFVTR